MTGSSSSAPLIPSRRENQSALHPPVAATSIIPAATQPKAATGTS